MPFVQDVKKGQQALWHYQDMIRQLLQKVTSGNPPAPHTIAAHLLSVKDPHTGDVTPFPCSYCLPNGSPMSLSATAVRSSGHSSDESRQPS